jgi:hypothetical protein
MMVEILKAYGMKGILKEKGKCNGKMVKST